jgi:hypothetical protein
MRADALAACLQGIGADHGAGDRLAEIARALGRASQLQIELPGENTVHGDIVKHAHSAADGHQQHSSGETGASLGRGAASFGPNRLQAIRVSDKGSV